MTQTIYQYGWDGEWFVRAYDDFGNKVGSKECEEGKIYIEPQGFCVLAGVGLENGMAKKALDSVDAQLATPHGIMIFSPLILNIIFTWERFHRIRRDIRRMQAFSVTTIHG